MVVEIDAHILTVRKVLRVKLAFVLLMAAGVDVKW
jgi:hypothetical protein